jgi:uncharacterized repeat protein (TIGR01451 family)
MQSAMTQSSILHSSSQAQCRMIRSPNEQGLVKTENRPLLLFYAAYRSLRLCFSKSYLLLICLLLPCLAHAQAFIDMTGPATLISGTDRALNAQYRYSNALPGIDVLVTLAQFSGTTPLLTLLDDNTTFLPRFQPVITCAGNAGARECFVRFDFAFVTAGTFTPTPVYGLAVSSQDTDGNGAVNGVRESVEFLGASSVTLGATTTLSLGTANIGGIRYIQNASTDVQPGIGTGNQYETYAHFTTGPITGFSIAGGNVIGTAGCNATNTACQRQNSYTFLPADSNVPSVTVRKVSNGGTGTFTFTGNNGWVTQPVSTIASGVTVSALSEALLNANQATTITESPPAGFTLESINCTGLAAGGTQTPTINGTAGGSVLLNAAATAVPAGGATNIVCTFVNRRLAANLGILKTNGAAVNTLQAGTTTTYTITASNLGPDSAAGAIIRDTPTAGLNCTTVSCTSTPAGICPSANFPFSNLSAGITIAPSFPSPATLTLNVTCGVTATGL